MRQFGKFRLVEHLASGGMADVWRAELPGAAGFVKEVALKLVRGEHGDEAFTRMFIQEARLASRLDHANIVHVFELGQVDGQYYIAMELVRGRTLREVVDRCRELGIRFGAPRAVHVGAEIARALAYAHRLEVDGRAAGLVHRDVSPQNVLLSYEGEVKLADFGIARAENADERTRAGTIKGKLAYMAPEQARGEEVDGRADVFALGVVLWELCTGTRLFAREGDAATLAALLDGAALSRPSEWNEAVPPELDAAILGALERDRDRRTGSAAELERVLVGLRHRLAASNPEEIDLRALLLRLWPDARNARVAPREPTAVMGGPPVPVAAEPERAPLATPTVPAPDDPGAAGARQHHQGDAPTRTLVKPRPFSAADQRRRTLQLLLMIAFGGAVVLGVLKWAGAGRGGEPSGAPAAPPGASTASSDASAAPAARPDASAAEAPPASPNADPPAAPGAEAPRNSGPPSTASGSAGAASAARAKVVVDVLPWATVYVDGRRMGDTPLTLQLPPGAHELRAIHPRLGSARQRVELAPGETRRWAPQLSR